MCRPNTCHNSNLHIIVLTLECKNATTAMHFNGHLSNSPHRPHVFHVLVEIEFCKYYELILFYKVCLILAIIPKPLASQKAKTKTKHYMHNATFDDPDYATLHFKFA